MTKCRLFDRFDLREYWVVDPEIETGKIHRRDGAGGFPRVAELSREIGDILTAPLLPGLMVPLCELFA